MSSATALYKKMIIYGTWINSTFSPNSSFSFLKVGFNASHGPAHFADINRYKITIDIDN
jgi:hypothetical protein